LHYLASAWLNVFYIKLTQLFLTASDNYQLINISFYLTVAL